jgi:hypothetical protein
MKAAVDTPRIFVFDAPAAELLMEADADYYRECQLARRGQRRDRAARSQHRHPLRNSLSPCRYLGRGGRHRRRPAGDLHQR